VMQILGGKKIIQIETVYWRCSFCSTCDGFDDRRDYQNYSSLAELIDQRWKHDLLLYLRFDTQPK
jgi:hypothetical protein